MECAHYKHCDGAIQIQLHASAGGGGRGQFVACPNKVTCLMSIIAMLLVQEMHEVRLAIIVAHTSELAQLSHNLLQQVNRCY